MSRRPEDGGAPRQDNGLTAPAFVPLTDVEPTLGVNLLTALGRARIAAYLLDGHPGRAPGEAATVRLFVASDDRIDARTVVAAAIRGLGDGADATVPPVTPSEVDPRDPDATRAAFDDLVADWHVDTVAAVREAERDLAREDADWRSRLNRNPATDEVWLDEDHYVPPAPPPLPRLAAPTIIAMTILAVSIVLLGINGQFGAASGLTLVLGVGGIVLGIGILFSRLREHHRDEDDDGAAL